MSSPAPVGKLASGPFSADLLLDLYVSHASHIGVKAPYFSALRTRSQPALDVIAQLAAPGHNCSDLVALAQKDNPEIPDPIDQKHLCALAAVLSQQDRVSDGLALYELAEKVADTPLPPEHQAMFAELTFGHFGQAGEVLERYPNMPISTRRALESDAAHPSRGGSEEEWLEKFRVLTKMPELELSDDRELSFFDRLTSSPLPEVWKNQKISIVMTCFEPGPELLTAVNSVIAQTWQNWELLLVDDASGPEYTAMLAKANDLDERVKMLPLATNSGTYRARNRGFVEATGSIVTGFDSDDWAHPRWLERQVKPLLYDPKLVMVVSESMRLREDLTVTNSGRHMMGPRSTSIMFRAAPVREHMGFFDSVRKGADTEFRMRFNAVFGDDRVKKLSGQLDTFVRISDGSLTSSEFYNHWSHPSRFAYQSSHRAWREKIMAGGADPYMPADAPQRQFMATSLVHGDSQDGAVFDKVFVLDCRYYDVNQHNALVEAQKALDAGQTVGLMHVESLLFMLKSPRPLHPDVLEFLHQTSAEFVSPTDKVSIGELVVTDQSLWQGRQDEYHFVSADSVDEWHEVLVPIDEDKPDPALAAPQPASSNSRKKASRAKRLPAWMRWRFASALVLATYVLAVGGWIWLDTTSAWIGTFVAASSTLFFMTLLVTPPGVKKLRRVLKRGK